MSNMGMVKGMLDMESGILSDIELQLIETKPDKDKTVRKNSKDLARAKEIYEGVHNFFSDVNIICIEIPVGSQSANAMKSYGFCIMLAVTLKQPLIEVTAKEVKKAATNNPNATKKDMINWAITQYPNLSWLKSGQRIIDKNEHLADALASIYAGVKTRQFQLLTIL